MYLEKPNRVTKEVGNTIFGALFDKYKVNWGQVFYEIVDKLVFGLDKGKPTPISSYLFHFYSKYECLREEELQEIEVARECLELGIAPEAETQPDLVELGSDKESLSPSEQQRLLASPPRSRMKTTYRSPKRKSPVRNFRLERLELS